MFYILLPVAALFSQVAVLAAVLALVVIIIMSIIILIAVWRKVRQTDSHVSLFLSFFFHVLSRSIVIENVFLSCMCFFLLPVLLETSVWDQMEGDRVCEPGWSWVHLRGPHTPTLWPSLGNGSRQPGAGWVLSQTGKIGVWRAAVGHKLMLTKASEAHWNDLDST